MSLESVKGFLAANAPDISIIEIDTSGATVSMAASAFGVEPGQIAKTLTLSVGEEVILLVTRGDARLDNRKYKDQFGTKTRFLPASEVEKATSHPVGGVGPFGVPRHLSIYCDISLRSFEEVLPAAGATNAGFRVAPARLAQLVNAKWVDVTQSGPSEESAMA